MSTICKCNDFDPLSYERPTQNHKILNTRNMEHIGTLNANS